MSEVRKSHFIIKEKKKSRHRKTTSFMYRKDQRHDFKFF